MRRRKGGGWGGAGLEIEDDEEEDEGVCWEERDSSSDEEDDELSGWFEDPPSLAHRQERLRNQEERAELSAFHSDELRRRQSEVQGNQVEVGGETAGELELPPEPGIEVLAVAVEGEDGSEDEMAIEPLGERTPPVVGRASSMMPAVMRDFSGSPGFGAKGRAQSVTVVGVSGGTGGVGRIHGPSPLGAHPSTTAAIRTGLSRLSCVSTPDIIIDDDTEDEADHDDTPTRPTRTLRRVSPDLLDFARDRRTAELAKQAAPTLAHALSTSSPVRWMDVDDDFEVPESSPPEATRPPVSGASEDPLALTDSPAASAVRCASTEAPLTNSPSRLLRDPTSYVQPTQMPTPPVSGSTDSGLVIADAPPPVPLGAALATLPTAPPSVRPTPQPRRIRHSFALVVPMRATPEPVTRRATIGGDSAGSRLAGRGGQLGRSRSGPALMAGKGASLAGANPTPSPSPSPGPAAEAEDELLLTSALAAEALSSRKRGRVSEGSPEVDASPGERVFGRRTSLRAGSRVPQDLTREDTGDNLTPRRPVRRPLTAAKTAPPRQHQSSVSVVRPPTPPSSRGAPPTNPTHSDRHSSPPKRRRASVAPSSASLFQPLASRGSTPGPFRLFGEAVKEEWVEPGEEEGGGLEDPMMLRVGVERVMEEARKVRRASVGLGSGGRARGGGGGRGLVRSWSLPGAIGRVEEESEDELALK